MGARLTRTAQHPWGLQMYMYCSCTPGSIDARLWTSCPYHTTQDGFCTVGEEGECCEGLTCGIAPNCPPNARCGTVCHKPKDLPSALPEAFCPQNKTTYGCAYNPCIAALCMAGTTCVPDYCKGCGVQCLKPLPITGPAGT